MKPFAILLIVVTVLLSPLQYTQAVEMLLAKELAAYCESFPGNNANRDSEFCVRYIQGFVDGAVSMDMRIMLNAEADHARRETFSERALRTRLPGRDDYSRAVRHTEFCLGDPVSLKEVIINVVDDLKKPSDFTPAQTARDVVYSSLKKHYPCKSE